MAGDAKYAQGWNTAALDDTSWTAAVVYRLPHTVPTFNGNGDLQGCNATPTGTEIEISSDVMEPTVRHSSIPALKVTTNKGLPVSHVVEMQELFSGYFEVANLEGLPNKTVSCQFQKI